MGKSPVRIEAGTRHVLASCTACASWRELRGTRPAAHLIAAAHMENVHGDWVLANRHRQLAKRDTDTQ